MTSTIAKLDHTKILSIVSIDVNQFRAMGGTDVSPCCTTYYPQNRKSYSFATPVFTPSFIHMARTVLDNENMSDKQQQQNNLCSSVSPQGEIDE